MGESLEDEELKSLMRGIEAPRKGDARTGDSETLRTSFGTGLE